MDLSSETLISVYRRMRTIRSFEETLTNLVSAGKIGGFMHLYAGEEAVAVTSIIHAVVPPLITLWHAGSLTRAEAVSHLTRAVGAIVNAYQRPAELH